MVNSKPDPQDAKLDSKSVSDGSELIPAEVQVNIRHDDDAQTEEAAIPGSTVDDEGLINNFATEPKIYPSTYPSSRQQQRYILLGAGAILFVAVLILISFRVS
ncbi:photosystem II assembly protein Psb34 [Nodosilinea nodulosa]|uniref:photosystem II assembly protein Psb34 n=1 Tax=Nodosilinea nodulosa TaxID=416001 RepID=UPI00036FE68F|nr:ssl1498 family light-harvesting-like protein [Nodosilinea nodulosa]